MALFNNVSKEDLQQAYEEVRNDGNEVNWYYNTSRGRFDIFAPLGHVINTRVNHWSKVELVLTIVTLLRH